MSLYARRATVSDLPLFAGAAARRAGGAALPPVASYPEHPGAKTGGTSAEAADSMSADAKLLRARVLEALAALGPMTADEIAAAIGRSVLAVRPRVSELHTKQRITNSGVRRTNASGKPAAVWQLAGTESR